MTVTCSVWDLDDACSDIPEGTPEEVVLQWQTVATELLWARSVSTLRLGPDGGC